MAGDRRQVIGDAAAGDPLVVSADIGGVGRDMGDPGLFPERNLAPPILFCARAGGNPNFEPHGRWVAPGVSGQRPQFGERGECRVARGIGERHVAVAVFCAAPEGRFGVPAIPDRHAPDAGRGLMPASSIW